MASRFVFMMVEFRHCSYIVTSCCLQINSFLSVAGKWTRPTTHFGETTVSKTDSLSLQRVATPTGRNINVLCGQYAEICQVTFCDLCQLLCPKDWISLSVPGWTAWQCGSNWRDEIRPEAGFSQDKPLRFNVRHWVCASVINYRRGL